LQPLNVSAESEQAEEDEQRRIQEDAKRKSYREADENQLRQLQITDAQRRAANYAAEETARRLEVATAERAAVLARREQALKVDGNPYALGGGAYNPQNSASVAKILTDARVEPDEISQVIGALANYRYIQ
jgi:hypothetical protein